jgi:FdhD protein
VLNIFLAPGISVDFGQLLAVFASSSCGLCGKATIKAVHHRWPLRASFVAKTLLALPSPARSDSVQRTGSFARDRVFDSRGKFSCCARLSAAALDKVLGHGLLRDASIRPPYSHGQRPGLVRNHAKALAARIPMFLLCRAFGLAVGFIRKKPPDAGWFLAGQRMNVYSL